MRRRRYLALLGSAVATAGCEGLDGSGDGSLTTRLPDTDRPSTASSTGTGTTVGTAETASGTTTVELFGSHDLYDQREAFVDVLHAVGLPADVTVSVERVPMEARGSIRQVLAAGESRPDLFLTRAWWTAPFVEDDLVLALEDHLSDRARSRVESSFDALLAHVTDSTGRLAGVPLAAAVPTMQYRADLLAETGYDPDSWETPVPWERFASVVADVQDATGTRYGYTVQADQYVGLACCTFREVLDSWGGAIYGGAPFASGQRPVTVDGEPARSAIRLLRTFLYGGDDEYALDGISSPITPTAALEWMEEASREPMARGEAVAHRNWDYSLALTGRDPARTSEPALGTDLGAVVLPGVVSPSAASQPGAGGSGTVLGGSHLVVNPQSERLPAAVAVLEAMTTGTVQLWALETLDWLPARPDLYGASRARAVEPLGRYLDTLRTAAERAIPMPGTSTWADASGIVAEEVHASLRQAQSPAAATATIAEALRRLERERASA